MPAEMRGAAERIREALTQLFLSDGELCSLLGEDPLWKTLIPQRYVPDVVEKAGTYLLYDVSEAALFPAGESFSPSYKRQSTKSRYSEITISVWLVTHRRTPTRSGRLRNDIAAERVTALLGENKTLGTAPCHFTANEAFDTLKREFTGRMLEFKVTVYTGHGRQP